MIGMETYCIVTFRKIIGDWATKWCVVFCTLKLLEKLSNLFITLEMGFMGVVVVVVVVDDIIVAADDDGSLSFTISWTRMPFE